MEGAPFLPGTLSEPGGTQGNGVVPSVPSTPDGTIRREPDPQRGASWAPDGEPKRSKVEEVNLHSDTLDFRSPDRQQPRRRQMPVLRLKNTISEEAEETIGKGLKVATDTLNDAMCMAELKLAREMKTRSLLSNSALKYRRRVNSFNQHRVTKSVVGFIICLNATYVGLNTDAQAFQGSTSTTIEIVFTLIFLLELALRLYAERGSFFFDGWNVLDFLLAALAFIDTLILHWVSDNNVVGISAIRILRLLRLVRVVRLFKAFKELWLFVTGILSALRTLAWAAPIMILLMYMFGITTTRIFGQKWGDEDEEMYDYFGTVPRSMFTLFQCMTTEGWADIARLTMLYEPWSGFFFVFFLSMTTFAITNVLVAVIVENAVSTALKDAEDLEKQAEKERVHACEHILQIFTEADTDGNCELSASEFAAALKKPAVKSWLLAVGIDVRQAETLFDILDYDSSGVLDFNEFVEGVMKARGLASAQDILAVHCDVWRSEHKVLEKIGDLQSQISELRNESRDQFRELKRLLAAPVASTQPAHPQRNHSASGAAVAPEDAADTRRAGPHGRLLPETKVEPLVLQ